MGGCVHARARARVCVVCVLCDRPRVLACVGALASGGQPQRAYLLLRRYVVEVGVMDPSTPSPGRRGLASGALLAPLLLAVVPAAGAGIPILLEEVEFRLRGHGVHRASATTVSSPTQLAHAANLPN